MQINILRYVSIAIDNIVGTRHSRYQVHGASFCAQYPKTLHVRRRSQLDYAMSRHRALDWLHTGRGKTINEKKKLVIDRQCETWSMQ
jgi:hypothetical protein